MINVLYLKFCLFIMLKEAEIWLYFISKLQVSFKYYFDKYLSLFSTSSYLMINDNAADDVSCKLK